MSQLHRIRWGVRGLLTLGVAASVAANILHARQNPISQAIAAWPPVALLLTIELVAKVPAQTRKAVAARIAATVLIAAIAAWVSYWHMAGVAGRYGEDAIAAHLLPLSVDGLIVVASVSLVEMAVRIRALEGAPAARLVASQTSERNMKPTSAPAHVPPAADPGPVREPARPARRATPRRAKRPPVAQHHPLRAEVEARLRAGETDLKALRGSLNGQAPSLRSIQGWARQLRDAGTRV